MKATSISSRGQLTLYFILLIAIILNCSMDRSAVSYAVLPIQQTFGLTNTQFGTLTSTFALGYLVMTLAGGFLADRWGVRRVLSFSVLMWSIAAILTGLSPNFYMLLLSRLLLGLAEGPTFPAYTRFIATHLNLQWRVRAASWGLAAIPCALVIGSPLVSELIVHWQWRLAFIFLGIGGALFSVLWFFIYREPICIPNNTMISLNSSTDTLKNVSTLLKNKHLLLNNAAFFAYGCTIFFAFSWLPDYFEKSYQLDLSAVGWYASLPWMVSTVMMLFGGMLSDALWARFKSLYIARSLVISGSLLLSVAGLFILITSSTFAWALWGISLGVGACFMACPAFYAINMDLAPDCPATSLGIMNVCFSLAGIISPPVIGFMIELTDNFFLSIVLLMCLSTMAALSIMIWQRPQLTTINQGVV